MDQLFKEFFQRKNVLHYEYLPEKLSKRDKKKKKTRNIGQITIKNASCFLIRISITFKVDRRTLE